MSLAVSRPTLSRPGTKLSRYEMKTLQYRGNATYFSFCKIGLKTYERHESAVQLPENEVSVFDNKHPKTTYMSQ